MPMPSPATVAALRSPRASQPPLTTQATRVKTKFKSVAELATRISIPIEEHLEEWNTKSGAAAVELWLADAPPARALVESWNAQKGIQLPLLAAILVEERLGTLGAEIGAYFKSSGSSYGAELLTARWMVARCFKRHASILPFHEPVVFVRAAEMARNSYRVLLPFAVQDESNRSIHLVEREIARQTVAAARFSSTNVRQLEEALRYLEKACALYPDPQSAALRVEAAVEIYHETGNRSVLIEAVQFMHTHPMPSDDWAPWHLNCAEVWLNLADHASPEARDKFFGKARSHLDIVSSLISEHRVELPYEIRGQLLKALMTFLLDKPRGDLQLRRVRLPFALRASDELPAVVYASAPTLMRALRPAAERGQYQYREYLAELASRVARRSKLADALELLRDAIRLRGPINDKAALSNNRDRLAQAQDLLLLGSHVGSRTLREEGITLLLELHREAPDASEPLVLLANNIELGGRHPLSAPSTSQLVQLIQNGSYGEIYKLAATRAFDNPALRISGLGGRGKTYTVDDFSGITGQTFVFKQCEVTRLAIEQRRAFRIDSRLKDAQIQHRYGLIEHIGELDLSQKSDHEGLVSVRRYVHGKTLRAALDDQRVISERYTLIVKSAEYLGFIHAIEREGVELPDSRKTIKERELGRWLARLSNTDKLPLFNAWWKALSNLPRMPRRDAHTLNWLVDMDGKILAADLEAIGSRPVTFELAQLIDDWPIFAPEDWDSRHKVLKAYLLSAGVAESSEIVVGYQFSTAARAVGLLTDPHASDALRNHGYRILQHFASTEGASTALSNWCLSILKLWATKTGVSNPSNLDSLRVSDRVRISKAMSFHLRHDKSAPTSKHGWIYAEDLAELLVANGHKVTAEQLLVVAGALGEPRFELDGQEIRATYGHSLPRRSDYEDAAAPKFLYHATPVTNLASIFEARAGLQPMNRQMVHLTPDPSRAMSTAGRHSSKVILLEIKTSHLTGLVRASQDTWLVPAISATELRIVPMRDIPAHADSEPT